MLNRNYIANVQVLIPPRATQRAIAEVLGALDDKIAANDEVISRSQELAALTRLRGTAEQRSSSRNAALTNLLADIPVDPHSNESIGENRGSGLPNAMRSLRQAGMSPARFDVSPSANSLDASTEGIAADIDAVEQAIAAGHVIARAIEAALAMNYWAVLGRLAENHRLHEYLVKGHRGISYIDHEWLEQTRRSGSSERTRRTTNYWPYSTIHSARALCTLERRRRREIRDNRPRDGPR